MNSQMKQYWFVLLPFCLLEPCCAQIDPTNNGDTDGYFNYMNVTTNLYNELFNKRAYNKYLTPIYANGSGSPLAVLFDLYYIKLISLDAESQLLSICMQLKTYWQDRRLAWNVTEFGGINDLFVGSDTLWIPDTQIGNAKTLDTIRADTTSVARVFSNGTIYFPAFYYTEVSCPILINTFPFDKQVCQVPVMSMAFDGDHVHLITQIDPFLLQYTNKKFVASIAKMVGEDEFTLVQSMIAWGNGEWDVTNISLFSMSLGGGDFTAYLIYVRRVPNYYVYVIALPCFILTTLSLVGMFWTPNIKKDQLVKLTIGLTSLVSMTVLLDMLSSSIPKTSVFPLLGIYVVCCVCITSLASVVITLYSLPNPRKPHHAIEPPNEKSFPDNKCTIKEKIETKTQRILKPIQQIFHRNIFILLFFQALNLIGFIVFLSYWD